MNPANSNTAPEVTADLIAEAAAWLAVLHGPNRTQATERGFAQWLKRSEAHAMAFEEATGIWEEARNVPRPRVLHPSFRSAHAPRSRFLQAVAIAAALAVVAVGSVFYLQRPAGISTRIGEQRVLALDDGSRIILNTDTRVLVSYTDKARSVELKEGEALFEVMRDSARPFIVTAGERTIRALGTSFVVRRDAQRLAVTLVEGKVAVAPTQQAGTIGDTVAGTVLLSPGERAIFDAGNLLKKDRPQLENLLAWERREVAFDNSALADAVTEMNRYNRKPLAIEVSGAGGMNVTGLFRAGDSLSFARAVAEAYDLQVTEEPDRIVLRTPSLRRGADGESPNL